MTMKRVDTEEFIRRGQKQFGNSFDYSETEYTKSHEKIKIICPTHGAFWVRASEHMSGVTGGCKQCTGKTKLTVSSFIERANKVFNGKYDYSLIKEVRSRSKVDIICPTHGVFSLRASEHYGGPKRGCPDCSGKKVEKNGRIRTTADLIERCRLTHGDKYDYSKAVYSGANEKVTVTCPQHGDFNVRASAHYGKQRTGCANCGGRGKVLTLDFINRSKEKFGNRFDYSKTSYKKATTKITITCPQHGDFQVLPTTHINGNGGCKDCSGRPDYSNQKFVSLLKEKFGNRYDYSLVEYQGAKSKIKLICPDHSIFTKSASSVLNSLGCPSCLKYTLEDFLEKVNKVHDKKYGYNFVDYKTTKDYVDINCPEHGLFQQTPNRHLDGRGCPTCGVISNLLTSRDENEECYLYYLELSYKGHSFWKVGITTKGLSHRFRLLKKDNVAILVEQTIITTIGKAISAESSILKKYVKYSEYRGHILHNAKGGTECFSEDVLANHGDRLENYL